MEGIERREGREIGRIKAIKGTRDTTYAIISKYALDALYSYNVDFQSV